MKTSRLRTFWILSALFFYTALTSIRTIFKFIFSTPSRPWVDKTIHHWIDQLLKEARVEYTVINPLNVTPQEGVATILMCNHSSAYDIPLGFKAFPNHSIRMLSKKELSKIPVLAKAMTAAEFPFIDRKNRYQAIKDLEYVKQLMKSGILVWIAPEGTRSKDNKLGQFKKGSFITAIESGATIIPIGIRGAYNILPARSFNINLNQKAEIHIGKPIDASEFSSDTRDELIAKTFKAIQELIGESSP